MPMRPRALLSRRSLLSRSAFGLGCAALHALGGPAVAGDQPAPGAGLPGLPHFPAKAKRVICLFQSGGPSHLDLFDPKPELDRRFDQDLPESVRGNQRITGMVAGQARLALQPSRYTFAQHGASGQWMSELLPHLGGVADELCVIRSLHTEAINHDPAITLFQTGSQQPGRPSMGAWLDYGLGSLNADLPAFVVMNSVPSKGPPDQGLLARLWGPGFLPSRHQGVLLRAGVNPVLYLNDPPGIDRARRRALLDGLSELNQLEFARVGDPEIETRIAQYEMAFRMQSSVPELVDLSKEGEAVFQLYGEEARKPGTFARNCLLARRLCERGVRFIQLYHRGWDHHGDLTERLPVGCRDIDQASAALIADLRARGMLDETLVVWAGEFGRTCYAQGAANRDKYGRDHHGRAFSAWLAGGGIKGGISWGASDDFGFNVTANPVHVHDLQATILHCLGIDHLRLTYRYQGRQFRLTDVEGQPVTGILA
jgi:uncharacterized protein (DUF1501 family)